MIRLARRRRLVIATMLTGAPAARDQHFIQHAYVTLERERQDTVRRAVARALATYRSEHGMAAHDETAERSYIDAVRDIAGYMAQRLMNERMGVLSDLARTGQLDAAREPFESVSGDLARAQGPIIERALELAPARSRGENVTREIAATVNAIMSSERFDLLIASAIPQSRQAMGRVLEVGAQVRHGLPQRSAIAAAQSAGLTRLERGAAWSVEMLAIIVDTLTRERTGRLTETPLSERTVLETRMNIQRYARDIGLNVAILLVVLLALIGTLAVP